MIRTAVLASFFALSLAACPAADDDDDSAGGQWAGMIQPMMSEHCGGCHEGAAAGSGGIGWLNGYDNVTATVGGFVPECDGLTRAQCLPIRLENGSMPASGACPPGEAGCITTDDFAMLEAWVADGFPE